MTTDRIERYFTLSWWKFHLHFRRSLRNYVSKLKPTAKALISLRVHTDRPGLSLTAYRLLVQYRIYCRIAKTLLTRRIKEADLNLRCSHKYCRLIFVRLDSFNVELLQFALPSWKKNSLEAENFCLVFSSQTGLHFSFRKQCHRSCQPALVCLFQQNA